MTRNTRNIQLDCLRGIAILLVIGVHFYFARPAGFVAQVAEAWERVGPVGVDLFFVLSGFLIGSLLLTELQKHGALHVPRFLIRRGFKLYPVYYAFLLYCLFIPVLKAWRSGGGAGVAWNSNWHELWPSLVFLQNYGLPNPEGHTWSLAVEEHFYIVLPFVILLLGARTWKWLIPVCLGFLPVCLGLRLLTAMTTPAEDLRARLWQTHLHVDALLLGVALAVTAIRYPEKFLQLGRRPRLLIAAGLCLWAIALVPPWPIAVWGTIGFTFRILGSAAILVGACNLPVVAPGKIPRALAWVGANSYAIYVWHLTVIGIAGRAAEKIWLHRVENPSLHWCLLAVTILLACIATGAIVTRLIERPSLNLRDRWFPSRGRAVTIPTPAEAAASAKTIQPDPLPV